MVDEPDDESPDSTDGEGTERSSTDGSDETPPDADASDERAAGHDDVNGSDRDDSAADEDTEESDGGQSGEGDGKPDTDEGRSDAEVSGADESDRDTAEPDTDESEESDEESEIADFEAAREAAVGPTPRADEQSDRGSPTGIGDEPAGVGDAVGAGPPENTADTEGVAADTQTDVEIDDAGTVGTAAPTGTGGQGPQEDQEMPLQDHIEEMVRRLAAVVAVAGVATAITFPFGEEIINFLWYSVLPGTDVTAPHIYNPPELIITQLKVASLAGVIIALPVLVYESYRFMRPGLYPNERRYFLAAVPTSLILAFVGVTFAYFIVLPTIFTYFYNYTEGVAGVAFALGRTFDLILVLMGYLALVFQIPLFIMLAMMMGLVTRRGLVERRLLFWGGFLGVSFLFSPDPTGMAPIIVTVTMIVLFEGTLLLAKWAGKE